MLLRRCVLSCLAVAILLGFCARINAAILTVASDSCRLSLDSETATIASGQVQVNGHSLNFRGDGFVFYDRFGKRIDLIDADVKTNGSIFTAVLRYSFGTCDVKVQAMPESKDASGGEGGGGVCFHWNVRNQTDVEQFVMLSLDFEFVAKHGMQFYTGKETVPLGGKARMQRWDGRVKLRERIPLAGVYSSDIGLAMGLAADEFHGEWVPQLGRDDRGKAVVSQTMRIIVNAKGSYDGSFVVFGFLPKYAERDAIRRYHAMYPAIFKRRNDIDPRLHGTSASYLAWKRNDAELSRLTGSDWEWCINPYRRNGDIADSKQFWNYTPVRPFSVNRDKVDVPRDTWLARKKDKFAQGQWCNTAMVYYHISGVWAESQLANEFLDSRMDNPNADGLIYRKTWGPAQDDAQAMFTWQTSYGDFVRQSCRQANDSLDIAGFGFDSPNPQMKYRGSALAKIKRKNFDEHGAYASNALAVAHLLDFVRNQNDDHGGKLGTVTNLNMLQHWLAAFHTDTCLIEKNPWGLLPPYPLQHRYAMGEKSISWWEGYHADDLLDLSTIKDEDFREAIRGLADYTALRSIFCGVEYQHLFSSGVEYLIRVLSLNKALNHAIWKPVPGFEVEHTDKQLWLSRFGQNETTFLAIGNATAKSLAGTAVVYPDELNLTRGAIFAEYYGHDTINTLASDGTTQVRYDIPTRKFKVAQYIMTLPDADKAKVVASVKRDFSRIAIHAVVQFPQARKLVVHLPKQRGDYQLVGSSVITLPSAKRHVVEVEYRSIKTDLTEQQILSLKALPDQLNPKLSILVNDDAKMTFFANRLQQCLRTVMAYRRNVSEDGLSISLRKYNRMTKRLNVPVPIHADATLPANTMVLIFDDDARELTDLPALTAANGSYLTGNINKQMLVLTGGNAREFEQILYDYMNLIGRTQFNDWYGTMYGGRLPLKLVPMTETDKELF